MRPGKYTLLLCAALGFLSTSGAIELTLDNYAELTAGKSVLHKMCDPWCGHCKSIKQVWDTLMKHYVQETARRQELCSAGHQIIRPCRHESDPGSEHAEEFHAPGSRRALKLSDICPASEDQGTLADSFLTHAPARGHHS
jgi:hypothetical protein